MKLLCSSHLLNTAALLPVSLQFLSQPLVLHQQQLHLVGLLQASRWQAVECAVAGGFCWLTRLDIPKRYPHTLEDTLAESHLYRNRI